MEELLRKRLSLRFIKRLGAPGGGCCNNAIVYDTDKGKIFVKSNSDQRAEVMLKGELASLHAILRTNTVKVPEPNELFLNSESKEWIFVMEHLDMGPLRKHERTLGLQLARLHLHNISLRAASPESYVDKFGFECTTSCGIIPMPNPWTESWMDFYRDNRLQVQIDLLEKEYKDKDLLNLWRQLKAKIPSFFEGISIEPSLLHGDLWQGNASETKDCPVIFDPASFYGHHEFDLAITKMFAGFSDQFYDAYHSVISQEPGFATRHKLYLLFHYLNHWNHFGTGYRSKSISLMKELVTV